MNARRAVRWLAVATFTVLLGCSGGGSSGGASDDLSTFGGSGPATSGGSGGTTSGGSTGDEEIIELRAETGQLGQMFAIPNETCLPEGTSSEEQGLVLATIARCRVMTVEVSNGSDRTVSDLTLIDTLTFPSLTRRRSAGSAVLPDEPLEQEDDDGNATSTTSGPTVPDESPVEPVTDIADLLTISSSPGARCDLDSAGGRAATVTCAFGDLQSGEGVTVELTFGRASNLGGRIDHAIDATGRI